MGTVIDTQVLYNTILVDFLGSFKFVWSASQGIPSWMFCRLWCISYVRG